MQISEQVDRAASEYVSMLAEAVAIPSVSATRTHRHHVHAMADWVVAQMHSLHISTEIRDPGLQMLDGESVALPPVVLGRYGADSSKRTVLVYAHYDVQPASREDGWRTDPFTLTADSHGRLFGRGATDDKGPLVAWLCVVHAHQQLGLALPVNLLFCFEGMEESGSEGLDDIILHEASRYFAGVDCVCISDNYWLGTERPCLTYGLRGVSTFQLAISGPGRDLHSGVFGGTVHEPMTDLVHLMAKLVDSAGSILVPGIYDSVAKTTDAEMQTYKHIQFQLSDIHNAAEATNTIHSTPTEALMARWRHPALSLHGNPGLMQALKAPTTAQAQKLSSRQK